ncbi:MAG: rod shape-determining protein RodA [Bacillota bacterium]|nr:rod shape-determining protein RodA [Bacillota bacterium]
MLDRFKIDRKLLRQFDFGALVVVLIIVAFGCMNIYSATHLRAGNYYLVQQLIALIVCLIVVYLLLLVDYTTIKNYIPIIYWVCNILLIVVLFTPARNGATGWIGVGNKTFQPSEFAKIAMIIMVAKKLDDLEGNINNVKNFFIVLFYAAVPMALILKEPDMGMTMVCFFTVLGMFFIAGLDLKVIIGGISSVIILIVVAWNSSLMEAYWKVRLTSFLHPEQDSLGAGLQLYNSEIGIGSGGLFGKGFLAGTQIRGGFIPENHTDFIFSVVGEEWGLVGAIILLVLYCILIFKLIKIAKNAKDVFGRVICAGIIAIFTFLVYQNIGMTIGVAPITGVTLPFMSYGGSSMLTCFISLALVLNIGMRRNKINF